MLTLQDYQIKAHTTSMDTDAGGKLGKLIYPSLKLAGETGEFCEKIGKILRDKNGEISSEDYELLLKELGDVLWYVCELATQMGVSMDTVASINLQKLASRKERDRIKGSGDLR